MPRHLPDFTFLAALVLLVTTLRLQAQSLPAELPGPGSHRGDSVTPAGTIVTVASHQDSISSSIGTISSLVNSFVEKKNPLSSEVRILAGPALPAGAFGQQDGTHPGFAYTGITLGLDYVMSGPIFGWISSVVVSRNPSDVASTHHAVYISLDLPPTTAVDVGPWYTLWAATGLQVTLPPFHNLRTHLIGQLGLLTARSSNVDYYIGNNKYQQAPVWSLAPSGTFGADVEISDKIFLMGRYMTSTPSFDLDTRGPDNFLIHNPYDQPMTVVQFLVGITI